MRYLLLVLCSFYLAHISPINGLAQHAEFQRYDGWYNNLAHPDWGSVGGRLLRLVPSKYADGVYRLDDKLPSARALSDLVFKGPDGLRNQRNATTMLAFFSQVVAYEILQGTETACPLEMHKVAVERCDRVFDPQCEGDIFIPFSRAKYDKSTGTGFNMPREQVNDKTAWIDASFLYSTQEPWVAAMRAYTGGKLAQGNMDNYPPLNNGRVPLINPPPPQIHRLMDPERLFLLGDPRVNENPGLLAFGLVLYRWHNVIADRLQAAHTNWSDEDLFQGARRWVVATLQNIVMYEFLPAILNLDKPIGAYNNSYKPHLPPDVSHLFAAAAFRFPHTLVPPGILLRQRDHPSQECSFRSEVAGYPALRMCQNWWNAQDIVQEYSVDEIILGMASQIAERDDSVLVSDLRDFLFGPMHFTRLDLAAMGIMRGRDNGLPDYNAVRKQFDLPPREWETINAQRYRAEPALFEQLRQLYGGDINKLDVYVGGMLENNGDGPGELFKEVIIDQFKRIRDADRFWFENPLNGMFTEKDLQEIRNTTLYDIIRATTGIGPNQIQRDLFHHQPGDPCPQPYQVNSTDLEPCVPLLRMDHFMGNEVTFIFTCIALGIIPIVCAGIGYLIVRRRKKWAGPAPHRRATRRTRQLHGAGDRDNNNATGGKGSEASDEDGTASAAGSGASHGKVFSIAGGKAHKRKVKIAAIEWLHENFSRSVMVVVENKVHSGPSLRIEKVRGGLLRLLDLQPVRTLFIMVSDEDKDDLFVLVNLPNDYDMVLRFDSSSDCSKFLRETEAALRDHGKYANIRAVPLDTLLHMAETKEGRQHKLEHFFREAYAKAFKEPALLAVDGTGLPPPQQQNGDLHDVSEAVLTTTLTRAEFADALGMRQDDLFIQRMFACVARRHKDKICFQDFLQTVHKFSFGTLEERLRMVFDMCDKDGDGVVDKSELCSFLRSLKIAAGVRVDGQSWDELIGYITQRAGVAPSERCVSYKEFEAMFAEVKELRRPVGLHLKGQASMNQAMPCDDRESLQSFAIRDDRPIKQRSMAATYCGQVRAFLEDYRRHIFCLTLFFAFSMLFFVERFWHYRYEVEHRDLRRVMGAGIAVTRGAAGAMSFQFGIILLTVCRNVITLLRQTALAHFVPFDEAIAFHKIVALTCGVFTGRSNFQPSISYWLFGTVTGITGILCVVVMAIVYVFAAPAIIERAYHAFRITHLLNILLYALTIAHGLPKLLDKPRFGWFIVGPSIVFVIDRIIGLRQNYKRLEIVSATLLPSNIILIRFKRPRGFTFVSGQWVRVACPAFTNAGNDWHAFTLASPPQEDALEIYVKSVGPWTWKLHNEISEAQSHSLPYPVLHMDGPYGAGNQEWRDYEVAVLVGGGIGVTPYASILVDLVRATRDHLDRRYTSVACKKVYFLWICPTHKNFEWFIDVLRTVEELDTCRVLDVHVFVTQFFHKFDLRTTMLYICEKHFRSEHGRSMFTDLQATNHFGRPNFDLFFKYVQSKHREQREIGVFSCGPEKLNGDISAAVHSANTRRDLPHLMHLYEMF